MTKKDLIEFLKDYPENTEIKFDGSYGQTNPMIKQSLPDTIEIDGVKYQKVVEEPQKPKTLHQMFYDDNRWSDSASNEFCEVVKEWMSQFHPDDMSFENLTYCNGFFDALDKLRSYLND